jgi:hypothetical protein
MQWKTRVDEISIHTKIERVLETHGIKIQTNHGGQLTGGAILLLLNNHDVIMDDISSICSDTILEKQNNNDPPVLCPTIEEMNHIIQSHHDLFRSQDTVYSHLRLINPTEQEMIETWECILVMEKLWWKMELSETPKAHLIFTHAADDQVKYGGLGDKIKDPLEKHHQEQV